MFFLKNAFTAVVHLVTNLPFRRVKAKPDSLFIHERVIVSAGSWGAVQEMQVLMAFMFSWST